MKCIYIIVAFFIAGNVDALSVKKISDLDGKYGISIIYGKRCRKCCDIKFSDDFGYNDAIELNQLKKLLGMDIDNNLNCRPLDYSILDHIVFLATKKQDKRAASLLLYPEAYGGLNISGELADLYALTRQAPVLAQYKNLRGILIPGTADKIVDNICRQALLQLGEEKPVNQLIDELKQSGRKKLADTVKMKCDKIKNKYYPK